MKFSEKNCIVKKNENVIFFGKQTSGMYLVDIGGAGEKAMTTPEVSGEILNVCHSLLAHADRTDIKQMTAIKAVISFNTVAPQPTRICSPCVELTIPHTAIKSRTALETRPGTVLQTSLAEMSVTSVQDSCYFVIFIDRISGRVSAFHLEAKAELPNC